MERKKEEDHLYFLLSGRSIHESQTSHWVIYKLGEADVYPRGTPFQPCLMFGVFSSDTNHE